MSSLYVVATPIGNLRDITLRALDVLMEVDFVICEDTRVTSFLLKHFDIHKELLSFNARTEEKKIEFILSRLYNGESCALVSDAGTPCISDPGVRLLNAAHSKSINVVGVPGASGVILALSIAGLPTDSFLFEGFLPQKKGRQKKLSEIANENRTVVLYESVYRISKLMSELSIIMPERLVVVCKELTKKFEQVWRGTPNEFNEAFGESSIKGEFIVLISPLKWIQK